MDGARAQLTVGGAIVGGHGVTDRDRGVTTAAGGVADKGMDGALARVGLADTAAARRGLPAGDVECLEGAGGGADDRSRTHALRPSAGSRIPSEPD